MKKIEIVEKDEQYYSDLIYAIKMIAQLKYTKSKKAEKRIEERMKNIEKIGEDYILYDSSSFSKELNYFILNLNKQLDEPLKSREDLKKYKELVTKNLYGLEYEKQQRIRKK